MFSAFIILNTFLLWKLHQMMALKKWKPQTKRLFLNGSMLLLKLRVGKYICNTFFQSPGMCYPAIADEHFTLKAKMLDTH